MELVANFNLNNESLDAQFDISEITNFDALFQIADTGLSVVGEGVINVTTQNGVATVTSTNFTFEQGVASDTWVITHNLNKRPSITVVDTADNIVDGAYEYIDNNTIKATFNGSFKGKAYLN